MSARIVRNERSWVIDMISMINIYLDNKTLQIKKVGGETTINTGEKTMFPDLLLYGDQYQTNILQGWEVKLPDTQITNEEFIKDAQRKADILGLNSCVLWNFTSAVLYIKDESGSFEIAKQWNDTSFIKTRNDVELYRNEWRSLIETIFLEINDFLLRGELISTGLEEIISDSLMETIISRNKPLVSEHLKELTVSNRSFNSHLNMWWREVSEEYLTDESNKFDAFSKHVLLNWLNKFSFAHAIKRYHTPAVLVEDLTFSSTPEDGNNIFNEISSRCDFYNIFKEINHGEMLPKSTWDELVEYNLFLSENGMNFNQSTLQELLERNVNTTKRGIAGQFSTPKLLAELLAKITINDLTWKTLDSCSGTGTIPKEILNFKKTGVSVEDAYASTWSSDKYSFPLQISNLNLTDIDSMNIPSRIFQSNVFDLESGLDISITDPSDGSLIELELPKFDAILSNLPFVPFSKIDDNEKDHLLEIVSDIENSLNISIGGRNDLYAYIVVKLWNLLKVNGKLGIIVSNSWLGTAAGRDFYNVIQKLYEIENVIISGKKRWFQNALVVTTIIILKKKENPNSYYEYNTHFTKLNISLSDLEDATKMEIVTDSIITKDTINEQYTSITEYSQQKTENILNLNVSINSLFHNVGWLLDIEDKLVEITSLFNVTRGERRGWDRLFYPNESNSIEEPYIKKVLKSSRNLKSLQATPDNDAFCCSLTIGELENLQHTGAIEWIRKFENGVNNVGKPLTESLKRANLHWYEMSDASTADMVTSLSPDKRLFYTKFEEPTFINQRLIGLQAINSQVDIELSHILLNSIISIFYLEAVGFGRGAGALDISKNNLEKSFLLNPNLLSEAQIIEIKEAFRSILERDVLTTEKEMEQTDRVHFERTVLQCFGIENLFNTIKNSLLSMQQTRLTAK